MKVICKQTTSQGFDLKEVISVFSNDFDYSYGGYGLELGREYFIMGIVTYQNNNCLYYLIDVNGKPDWFPYVLFEMTDNSIPRSWFIKVYGKNDDTDIYSLCGFNELCNENNFYDQLLERNERAMRIYFIQKIELEKSFFK
ncbi:MAG: hypothetical protein WAT19_05795 [Ferruginibacter sp.]